MRKLLLTLVAGALIAVPVASQAHSPVGTKACTDTMVEGASRDCVRVYTDSEFEEGIDVGVDGDDSDPRGDGTSDGYVLVSVDGDGNAAVYCEDEGGYNYPDSEGRPEGDTDDANGTNEPCEP